MRKFFKLLIGAALLPFCSALSLAVYALYQNSLAMDHESLLSDGLWLPSGFTVWVIIFFILPRPMRTYVLGHELTHAFWALMMGARIGRMHVGKSGGHVELSRTNFLITLAPYFFPLYTVFVIATYYLCVLFFNVAAYRGLWLAAVGFTWAFHLTFTISMLADRQPDIQEHGHLFSYTIIYCMNLLTIGIWMIMIGAPEWSNFAEQLTDRTAEHYQTVWEWAQYAYGTIMNYFAPPPE